MCLNHLFDADHVFKQEKASAGFLGHALHVFKPEIWDADLVLNHPWLTFSKRLLSAE